MGPGRRASLSASCPCNKYRWASLLSSSAPALTPNWQSARPSSGVKADGAAATMRYVCRAGKRAVSSDSSAERKVSRSLLSFALALSSMDAEYIVGTGRMIGDGRRWRTTNRIVYRCSCWQPRDGSPSRDLMYRDSMAPHLDMERLVLKRVRAPAG